MMATIIDSFVVKLGLDGKEFKTGMKEADASIQGVSKSVTGFLALLGGTAAIKHFVTSITEVNAELTRLSANLGVSSGTLAAFGNAAEIAGGSAEGLQATFDMLSKAQTELQTTGNTGILPYLSMLGVAFGDVGGQAEMLLEMARSIETKGLDRVTANNILRGAGIDQGTANLMLKGSAEFEREIKRQKALIAITDEQRAKSEKLRQEWERTKKEWDAIGQKVMEVVTPALEKLVDWLSKMGEWVKGHGEFVRAFFMALGTAFLFIQRGAIGAALSMAAALAPVLLLSAGLALLWDDYQKWKDGGNSLIGDNWQVGIDAAVKGLRWMGDLLEDIVYRAFAAADAIGALADGDWKRAKYAAGQVLEGHGRKYGSQPEQQGGTVKHVGGLASGETDQKADMMMKFLMKQGLSPVAAAGLAANFQAESGFNPAAVGDSGKAYGIGQWHPDRQAKFKDVMGFDIQGSSIFDQAKFAVWELNNTHKKAGRLMDAAGSAGESGAAGSRFYEIPRDAEGEAAKRSALASLIYGRAGASSLAQNSGAAARARSNVTTNASTVNNTVGEMKIYTAATDANGIVADYAKAMDYQFAAQSAGGLN